MIRWIEQKTPVDWENNHRHYTVSYVCFELAIRRLESDMGRRHALQRALALVEEIYDGKQWKRLATRLTWPDGAHITAEDMAAIQARCPDDIPAQAQKMLMLWRARCGKMASTESLMLALKSSDQTDVAERIEKLLDQQ
ncbi:hypothetical protein Bbelb_300200 [Branchiostoma belcheri]|nr:hypothetical protein Bbelb_300200 [Branchiostoma belcheri]